MNQIFVTMLDDLWSQIEYMYMYKKSKIHSQKNVVIMR